jgi:hypothetical protein
VPPQIFVRFDATAKRVSHLEQASPNGQSFSFRLNRSYVRSTLVAIIRLAEYNFLCINITQGLTVNAKRKSA